MLLSRSGGEDLKEKLKREGKILLEFYDSTILLEFWDGGHCAKE